MDHRMDDTPGGSGMGATNPSAEVHARVSNRPAGTHDATGRAESVMDDAKDRIEGMADQARERAGEMADHARERAGEMAGRAREGLEHAADRAETLLEERTGALSYIRSNPLPAVGIAFAAGFLLAGSGSDKRSRRGIGGRVRGQVRGAVMGAVTAAFARELRNIAGLDGEGGLLSDLLGGKEENESRSRPQRPASSGGYGRGASTMGRGGL